MSDNRRERARVALRGTEYQPLWATARRRLERNGLTLEGSPLRLDGLAPAERLAIAGLLGVSAAGDRPLRVPLATLDERLRLGAAAVGLVEWIEMLDGSIRNRPAERAQAGAEREVSWSATEAHPVLSDRPELQSWLAGIRSSGAATRMAGSVPAGAELAGRVLDVLTKLPANNVTLAQLAARLFGDAHALDRDRALGRLVDAALKATTADADYDSEWVDGKDVRTGELAYDWRRRWAIQGVICDDLSVSVLALNLPAGGTDIIAGMLDGHSSFGMPVRLTLRQLGDADLEVARGTLVRICENPSVVAHAATTLEDEAAPLVCVEGQPNTAAFALLDLLAADGCRFAYHGDFDWGGLRIARSVIDRYGAKPWRFQLTDYLAAADLGRLELGPPPSGMTAAWAPGLVDAMANASVAIHEEQVLDGLLADLARRR
ncbi:MAG: TIGR02679 family protein [Microthrixaceae bacterium]